MKKHAKQTATRDGIAAYKGFIVSERTNATPARRWHALSEDGADQATDRSPTLAFRKARMHRRFRLAAEELECRLTDLPGLWVDVERILTAARSGAPLGAHLARYRWLTTAYEQRATSQQNRRYGIS